MRPPLCFWVATKKTERLIKFPLLFIISLFLHFIVVIAPIVKQKDSIRDNTKKMLYTKSFERFAELMFFVRENRMNNCVILREDLWSGSSLYGPAYKYNV